MHFGWVVLHPLFSTQLDCGWINRKILPVPVLPLLLPPAWWADVPRPRQDVRRSAGGANRTLEGPGPQMWQRVAWCGRMGSSRRNTTTSMMRHAAVVGQMLNTISSPRKPSTLDLKPVEALMEQLRKQHEKQHNNEQFLKQGSVKNCFSHRVFTFPSRLLSKMLCRLCLAACFEVWGFDFSCMKDGWLGSLLLLLSI